MDANVSWLNFTNIALGVLCAVCWAFVVVGVVQDLAARRRRTAASIIELGDHAFYVPGLGTTMADGGEPVEDKKQEEPRS